MTARSNAGDTGLFALHQFAQTMTRDTLTHFANAILFIAARRFGGAAGDRVQVLMSKMAMAEDRFSGLVSGSGQGVAMASASHQLR